MASKDLAVVSVCFDVGAHAVEIGICRVQIYLGWWGRCIRYFGILEVLCSVGFDGM